jgi:uncharacterized membrane protein
MKKIVLSILTISGIFILSNCNPSKKATASVPAKLTYTANLMNIVADNCSPCHFPEKGGKKKAYDTYISVKADIDDIIRRIELNPTDRGFMPFKKTTKLNDSTIAVFKQWKADGMLEN